MPLKLNIPREELKKYYVDQRLSSRIIAKAYNCAYSTIDRKIRQFGFPIRTLADAHIKYKRTNFSENLNEKAYMIGFRIGDLRVRKVYKNSETIHVDCRSTQLDQIELIHKLFSPYGRVWIGKPNVQGKIQIECFLNNSFEFLLKTNPNQTEPWIIMKQKYFAQFLAGFIDAEGTFFIYKNRAFFGLGNYNIALLQQIQKALKKFGIESPKITRSVRKGLVASHGYRYNHDYWNLSITKKTELIKLFSFIGPYLKHAKRIRSMEAAIKNIEMRNILYGK